MTRDLGIFTLEDSIEIGRRVLGNHYKQPPTDNTRDKTIHNDMYYVVLIQDLAAATDPLTGYTSAQGRVIRYLQPIVSDSLDMEDSTTDEGLVTVTNRYTTFSASIGDLLLIIRNESEWSPVTAASGNQRHARITQCLGNGYYTANLSLTPTFTIPSSSETGTGTIAGVGTGSGLTNECDLCSLLYGGNEPVGTATDYGDAVCNTLVQPTRTSVPGDGALIYVYDPRKLALEVGAHIVVSDLGDTANDPNPVVGTGTGTSIPQVKVWMVLTGNYDLIGIPDRFYECCTLNGVQTVKMVRCDTYIVEGVYCQGNQTYCPVGTGTP
jgi:hypothetical protein